MNIFNLSKKIVLGFLTVLGTAAFAQSSGFPSISSPSMPTISSPVLGSSYYKPGSNKKSSEKSSEEIKPVEKITDTTPSVEKVLSNISPEEIQLLNGNGSLGNILNGTANSKSTEETNDLLKKVLTELEDSKKSGDQKTVSTNSDIQSNGSRVLRFKINGYDLLHTCKSIYISDLQEDGTFLVTGDRRYQSTAGVRNETFHLLFKADTGANGIHSYKTAAAVTQNITDENSYMYQLSQRNDLVATKTGNLVTMRTIDPSWKLELLIDLGSGVR